MGRGRSRRQPRRLRLAQRSQLREKGPKGAERETELGHRLGGPLLPGRRDRPRGAEGKVMREEALADRLLREAAEDEGVDGVKHIVQRKSRLRKSTKNTERKK